jgi:hypothetical protein
MSSLTKEKVEVRMEVRSDIGGGAWRRAKAGPNTFWSAAGGMRCGVWWKE